MSHPDCRRLHRHGVVDALADGVLVVLVAGGGADVFGQRHMVVSRVRRVVRSRAGRAMKPRPSRRLWVQINIKISADDSDRLDLLRGKLLLAEGAILPRGALARALLLRALKELEASHPYTIRSALVDR